MIVAAVFDTKPYDKRYLGNSERAGEINWRFHEFRLSADTAAAAKGACSVCIFVNDVANQACLEKLASFGVKHVALRCAGYNNVDIRSAGDLGIVVTRVPKYSPHAVAEHAVGLLLTLNRKIHRAYNRVREYNFSINGLIGFDIAGKTVGIVGTGHIGKVAAKLFTGFEATVIAYDPFPSGEWAKQNGVTYVDFTTLLMSSDILSLHLPLLPETHHLLNSKTFALMKQGAYLINTSRGKLIDSAALIDCLKNGKLGGVALDVYEEEEKYFFEDLSGQALLDEELARLLTFPNVLITAHQAFLTDEGLAEISRITTENILRVAKGEAPLAQTALS